MAEISVMLVTGGGHFSLSQPSTLAHTCLSAVATPLWFREAESYTGLAFETFHELASLCFAMCSLAVFLEAMKHVQEPPVVLSPCLQLISIAKMLPASFE